MNPDLFETVLVTFSEPKCLFPFIFQWLQIPKCRAVDREASLWVELTCVCLPAPPSSPRHFLAPCPRVYLLLRLHPLSSLSSLSLTWSSLSNPLLLRCFLTPASASHPPSTPSPPVHSASLVLPTTSSSSSPPQHTCRPRSGTCSCLWGPVFSSSSTCGLCKSGSSSSSRTSITSFPSTHNTTSTTSRNTSTTARARRCTSPSPCRREVRPDRPGTGRSRASCWSRTWRVESKR